MKSRRFDEPFIMRPLSLLASMAWRVRQQSPQVVRLLEFLEEEHLRHAGRENGRLRASYADLENYGLRRQTIGTTIAEAERLGLLRATRGGFDLETGKRRPTLYRLTYLETSDAEATDEWRRFIAEVVPGKNRLKQKPRGRPFKIKNPGVQTGTESVPVCALGENEKSSKSAKNLV